MDVTLASIAQAIPDEEAAYTWFESIRWPHGPVCPHCGVIGHAYHLKPKGEGRKTRTGAISFRKVWKCGSCRKQFTVTIGTCMQGSKIPLRKWAIAFHLLSAGKNGVSSHELGRQLQVSHESAWFMSHRIRYAFQDTRAHEPMTGIVEADETYVGGKHSSDLRAVSKTPIFALVNRDGEARAQVMQPVTAKNVRDVLWVNVDGDASLMTDGNSVYKLPAKMFASHEVIDHSQGEYVRGKVHTNTVEGFFSQIKRSLDGTHHHVTAYHLHRYVGEFSFRYNTRKMKDGERTQKAIRMSVGKRLQYQEVKSTKGE